MSSLVIAVNYKTDEHAVNLVRSLAAHAAEDIAVVLVDNSERDDIDAFTRMIHAANADVQCVQAPRNLGYFGGANFGLKRYLVGSLLPTWIVICNVDIEFRDPNFFVTLTQSKMDDSVGVVGPCIWSGRFERDLNPKIKQRPTRQRMLFYRTIFGSYYLQAGYEFLSIAKYGLRALLRNLRSQTLKHSEDVASNVNNAPIYASHGSCMIFSERYFALGGNIDYPVFLYGEEIFVAETARQLGLSVIHCPQLWVFDREHASTRGALRSRKVAGYMNEATQYLLQKYFA